MPLRSLAKIAVAFGEAITKAFARAVKEEMNATRGAAERQAQGTSASSSSSSTRQGQTDYDKTQEATRINAKMGISLQESMQILNVRPPLSIDEVEQRYKHLFEANDKSKGGTLYLQSKVFRAKQRLDEELTRIAGEKAQAEGKSDATIAGGAEQQPRKGNGP